jgi:DNA-binding SARP family transcriptional activator
MPASAGKEDGKKHVAVVVSLTGRVAIQANGTVVQDERFAGRQGRLVFAYLAINAGRPVPRDELAEALWGDARPATWEKALTGIISKLRALLDECGADGTAALTNAFGCYRLELPEDSSVDVLKARPVVDDAQASSAELVEAKRVVETPFLPGDEAEWIETQRRELGEVRVRALERLVDASLCLRRLCRGDEARTADR